MDIPNRGARLPTPGSPVVFLGVMRMIEALGYLKDVGHKKEGTILKICVPTCSINAEDCRNLALNSGRSGLEDRVDVKISVTQPHLPDASEVSK